MQNTIDWDDAYSNAAYIPDAYKIAAAWPIDAAAFRNHYSNALLDVPYGNSPRQKYDLFMPEKKPIGLAIFIHGGYWLEFDKSSWSQFAEGALQKNWAIMLPSYDLCPHVHISDITKQIGLAITSAALRVKGPIHISGHSAGGHLAFRMGCMNTPLTTSVSTRVQKIVGISGLYDLNPLCKTAMNNDLRITPEEATQESPIFQQPIKHIDFTCAVGSIERPEFIRQSKDMTKMWSKAGTNILYHEEADKHHFNVIDSLKHAESALAKTLYTER
ncbi:alpha/beta hydrolase [Kordiimonas pumila]|uniref:Alpha/beta hydrolase n=1 Tax=Kordiimonas pumila TaxID=2161677 RepID=A0ABV7D136_9PROT|nr:alpha/beta hydrolase [Kordiimonas pumila]